MTDCAYLWSDHWHKSLDHCKLGLKVCPDDVTTCLFYVHPDDEIDHDNTNNLVCPYCGYEDRDSWEVCPNDEDLDVCECGSCGKEFRAWRNISITYSTEKLDDESTVS